MHRAIALGALGNTPGLSSYILPTSAFDPDRCSNLRENIEVAQASVNAAAAPAVTPNSGFTAIRSVDWVHGTWRVKAIGSDGLCAVVFVEAQTGALTPYFR